MKKNVVLIGVTASLLCLFNTTFAERTIWYVHPDSSLNTIQAGLDSCATNDIVLVAPGIYVENITWPNTQGIHLLSELGPDTTIIDGDSIGSVIVLFSGADTTTIISGFTIQNGCSTEGGGENVHEFGTSETEKFGIFINPNPCRSQVAIRYSVHTDSEQSKACLKIYDITGRLVKRLLRDQSPMSKVQNLQWDGTDENGRILSNGIYFVVLEYGGERLSKKLVLIK